MTEEIFQEIKSELKDINQKLDHLIECYRDCHSLHYRYSHPKE